MSNFNDVFDNSKCNYSDNDIEIIKKFLEENHMNITNAEQVNDFHIEDSKEDMEMWFHEVAPNKEWINKQRYCQLKDSKECLFFYHHPANL